MAKRNSRRQVLTKTLLGFGGYAMGSVLACKKAEPPSARSSAPVPTAAARSSEPPKPLTAAQMATLSAACERILPRDEDPGATDLGCADYIARCLQDPDVYAQFGRALPGGLSALDRQSRTGFKKAFSEAAPAEQDQLLSAWQHSRFRGETAFFEVLHTMTLEGAFGDPTYGGNRDGQGYLLVGFVPPPPAPGTALLRLNRTSKGTK